MSPHAIARLLRQLEATVPKCTHLGGGPAAYAYLRHLIMPGTYWTMMFNPAKDEQLRVLLSLPSADYIYLQPITLCCPVTHTPTEGRCWRWRYCQRLPSPLSTWAPPSALRR